MTQYDEKVELQRQTIEATKWAEGVRALHSHSLDSMWYADGRKDGSVCDTEYNDGRVRREIRTTGKTVWLNMENVVKGDELLRAYSRGSV